MSDKRTKIGVIGVDAGICWIGDPCYILHRSPKEQKDLEKSIGKNWSEFCDKASDNQFNYPMGHEGLGVCVSTGYGDGTYPVYVEYNDEGRVAKVTVEFIGDDED